MSEVRGPVGLDIGDEDAHGVRVRPLPDQERSPSLHDLAASLQHIAAGVALLDLAPDGVGQGLLRQLPVDPLVRAPGPERAA